MPKSFFQNYYKKNYYIPLGLHSFEKIGTKVLKIAIYTLFSVPDNEMESSYGPKLPNYMNPSGTKVLDLVLFKVLCQKYDLFGYVRDVRDVRDVNTVK